MQRYNLCCLQTWGFHWEAWYLMWDWGGGVCGIPCPGAGFPDLGNLGLWSRIILWRAVQCWQGCSGASLALIHYVVTTENAPTLSNVPQGTNSPPLRTTALDPWPFRWKFCSLEVWSRIFSLHIPHPDLRGERNPSPLFLPPITKLHSSCLQ